MDDDECLVRIFGDRDVHITNRLSKKVLYYLRELKGGEEFK